MKRIVWGSAAIGLTMCLVLALYVSRDGQPDRTVGAAHLDFRPIAFEDLQFQEPIVRDRLSRVEAQARVIVSPDWQHVRWHWREAAQTPEKHFIFATQWCSRPSGEPYCSCSRDMNPCHLIDLVASPRDSGAGRPKKIYSWQLIVRDYPQEAGWGVRMSYAENWHAGQQIQEHFSASLYRARWSPNSNSEPALRLPCDSYELRRRFGSVEYVFVASLEEKIPRFHQAREYVSSAARLRETVLAAQDALEALVRKQIESGSVARVLDDELLVQAPPTRNPPDWGPPMPTAFKPPIPAKYALTPEQKTKLRDQLAADLNERRRFAREEADEIHAALEKAFPLGRVLGDLDNQRTQPAK